MASSDFSNLKSVDFLTYTDELKRKLSVRDINSHLTTDDLGIPIKNGLSDYKMGSSEAEEICTTCSLNGMECPGHFGIIPFSLPVYNPMFFPFLVSILKGSCFICHHVYIKKSLVTKFIKQYKLMALNMIPQSYELDRLYGKWQNKGSKNYIHSKDLDEFLKSKIIKYYKTIVKRMPKKGNIHQVHSSHSLHECRVKLINNFIRTIYMDHSLKKCTNCNFPQTRIKTENSSTISIKLLHSKPESIAQSISSYTSSSTLKLDPISLKSAQHLTAGHVREHFHLFYDNEAELIMCLTGRVQETSIIQMFFMDSILVIPPKFRPVSLLGDSKFENASTGTYKKIILHEKLLKNTIQELSCPELTSKPSSVKGLKRSDLRGIFAGASSLSQKLHESWLALQTSVNTLFDGNLNRNLREEASGLRQLLEKKEGLFRMNMMGKRVNQAARSVISPDPMLDIDEVGIPYIFAKKLTYSQHLTDFNSQNLISSVCNGPNIYPGASHIEYEDNKKVILNANNLGRREAHAKTLLAQDSMLGVAKVRRHLQDGDLLLMNRQPSLHRPSIMGHRARVIPKGQTIRLHYAVCKSYNADFDGDEMNAHFPQNEIGRSEGYNISSMIYQYLSPRDGKPLIGLIQDYMVAGVIMTLRDTFLSKEQYHNIIYSAIVKSDNYITTFPPSILKPQALWTGKQVVSTLIINCSPPSSNYLNMRGTCKVTEKLWSLCNPCSDQDFSDDIVLIRDGHMLTGILDKNQFGSSPYGIIHCFYEIYGGYYANKLLSVLGRACISLLHYHGFSMGIEDVVCTEVSNKIKDSLIQKSKKCGFELLSKVFDHPSTDKYNLKESYKKAHLSVNDKSLLQIDAQAKDMSNSFQNEINKTCSSGGLIKTFPSNGLQLMIQSGAKGTPVNAMQISGLLGQMELEGHRPPLMCSGRTLPCYQPYESSLESGGFVDASFLTGLRPYEYFFHCMAGREGLVDTAVKTSRSGYLQRCLIKHMEGIKTGYDYSARDSDGSMIQFLYGEDGCDPCTLQFAHDKKFDIFAMNCDQLSQHIKPEQVIKYLDDKSACTYQTQLDKILNSREKSVFKTINGKLFLVKNPTNIDPTVGQFNPGHYYGAVSEAYMKLLNEYLSDTSNDVIVKSQYPSSMAQCNSDKFKNIMLLKYSRCLSTPGEAVGVLASQSVGEPSTQMTLNTFHFAGRGDMNVTLGIPRLREIFLIGNENIKTPSISIKIRSSSDALLKAEKLKLRLTPIPLSNIVTDLEFRIEYEKVISPKKMLLQKCYVRMNFISRSAQKSLKLSKSVLIKYIERVFIRKLIIEILKKSHSKIVLVSMKDSNIVPKEASEEKEESEDEEDHKTDEKMNKEDGSDAKEIHENDIDHENDQSTESPEDEVKSDQEEIDEFDEKHEKREHKKGEILNRIEQVLSKSSKIIGYKFDEKSFKWCEFILEFDLTPDKLVIIPIIKKLVNRSYINQTDDILKCFITKDNTKDSYFHLEGNNIYEMWKYNQIFNLNTLYSNNIQKMAQSYGIEAARNVLVKEIGDVFKVYGITVNTRHLTLLADYMTHLGHYNPCNRFGISSNPSAFQKMSFETTINFLKNAVTFGEFEPLESPSSRIVTGLPINIGTGSFELIYKNSVF